MNGIPWHKAAWWSAAIYVLIGLLNHFLGFGLDAAYLAVLIIPILAIIFGDAWVAVELTRLKRAEVELATAVRKGK
jgi:hypothetical protein